MSKGPSFAVFEKHIREGMPFLLDGRGVAADKMERVQTQLVEAAREHGWKVLYLDREDGLVFVDFVRE